MDQKRMAVNQLERTYLCLRLSQLQLASSKQAIAQAKDLLAKPIYPFEPSKTTQEYPGTERSST
jgi:hypothetical protein